MELYIAPEPKKISRRKGFLDQTGKRYIQIICDDPQSLVAAAEQSGLDFEITASPRVPEENILLRITVDPESDLHEQGYRLVVKPRVIEIIASTSVGAFYAASTLKQIVRQSEGQTPCLAIEDWPDIPNRGIMLDVSRDKVPMMETLYHIVDLMADWKLNQLQLYTEHTFAYLAHPTVWEHASPMTGEEIMALDKYCRERFIELVPNQNSFGHMDRWLKHDKYRSMAESPKGGNTIWNIRMEPFGLCPGDKRSLPFVAGLFEELLPHFSSCQFNVGCDETVDLGFGRSKRVCKERGTGQVYLDFLKEIHRLVESHGRTMQFWGDIVIHHPELIPELPENVIALDWGYEANHPFPEETRKFAEAGIPFYVCPGTSAWNCLCGQTEKAIINISSAARNGYENGTIGLLNTSWGDCGHWNPVSVEYLGFLTGGMMAWNTKTDPRKTLAENLSLHVFEDKSLVTGRAFYELGNLYRIFKKFAFNSAILWQLLFLPMDNAEVTQDLKPSEFDDVERKLGEIEASLEGEKMEALDADIVRRELAFVIRLVRLAISVGRERLAAGIEAFKPTEGLLAEVEAVKNEHREVWMLRNRPGGLEDSIGRMKL